MQKAANVSKIFFLEKFSERQDFTKITRLDLSVLFCRLSCFIANELKKVMQFSNTKKKKVLGWTG